MTASPRSALGLLFAAPAALAHEAAAPGGGAGMLLLFPGAAATAAAVRKSGRPLRSGRDVGDRV